MLRHTIFLRTAIVCLMLILLNPCLAAEELTEPAVDMKDLRDVCPPEDVPAPPAGTPVWLPVAIGSSVIVVIAVLVAGGLAWRRRQHRRVKLSPREWAVHELDRIQAMGFPTNGDVERYYTLISDVVRGYLDMRFHIHAQRQTTFEFLEAIRQSPAVPMEQQTLLREFLERCDLAKFARVEMPEEECQRAVAAARALVEEFSSKGLGERGA